VPPSHLLGRKKVKGWGMSTYGTGQVQLDAKKLKAKKGKGNPRKTSGLPDANEGREPERERGGGTLPKKRGKKEEIGK